VTREPALLVEAPETRSACVVCVAEHSLLLGFVSWAGLSSWMVAPGCRLPLFLHYFLGHFFKCTVFSNVAFLLKVAPPNFHELSVITAAVRAFDPQAIRRGAGLQTRQTVSNFTPKHCEEQREI
jgi:hypothetical protein